MSPQSRDQKLKPTKRKIVTSPSDKTETMPLDRTGTVQVTYYEANISEEENDPSKASSPELTQSKESSVESKYLSERIQDEEEDLSRNSNQNFGESTADIQVDTINGVFMESDKYCQSGSDT